MLPCGGGGSGLRRGRTLFCDGHADSEDDGDAGTVEWIIPVLKQYGMRATMFIIGSKTYNSSGSKFITFSRLRKLQRTCSNVIEFQSHTWADREEHTSELQSRI